MYVYVVCGCPQHNLLSARAKRLCENAQKGGAMAELVLYEPTNQSPVEPEAAHQYTHVITDLPEPETLLLSWLGLQPHGQGGPLFVKAAWCVPRMSSPVSHTPQLLIIPGAALCAGSLSAS